MIIPEGYMSSKAHDAKSSMAQLGMVCAGWVAGDMDDLSHWAVSPQGVP
jgi:hypothetical protein